MDVEQRLLRVLETKHLTISSCESFTAGLFCSTLAAVPGASAVLRGGIVTYASQVKVQCAHVDENMLALHGVISVPCAEAMAKNVNTMMQSDICVSFTGNAGPDAMEGKPAGLCYIGICFKDHVYVHELFQQKERNALRLYAVKMACQYVLALLEKESEGHV